MDFLISILTMLALAIGVIAIMVALFSASWQVLLIVLIGGIVVSQWLIHQHHLEKVIQDVEADLDPNPDPNPELEASELEEISATDTLAENTFKFSEAGCDAVLSYRGASYQKPDSVEADTSVVEGKYRGQNWQSSC